MTELFETIMLICFGCSWPLSVIKNFKSGTAKSMSLPFILLILLGYVAGISAKFISGQKNFVLVVYFMNLLFVLMNLFIFFMNSHKDKQRNSKEN